MASVLDLEHPRVEQAARATEALVEAMVGAVELALPGGAQDPQAAAEQEVISVTAVLVAM